MEPVGLVTVCSRCSADCGGGYEGGASRWRGGGSATAVTVAELAVAVTGTAWPNAVNNQMVSDLCEVGILRLPFGPFFCEDCPIHRREGPKHGCNFSAKWGCSYNPNI